MHLHLISGLPNAGGSKLRAGFQALSFYPGDTEDDFFWDDHNTARFAADVAELKGLPKGAVYDREARERFLQGKLSSRTRSLFIEEPLNSERLEARVLQARQYHCNFHVDLCFAGDIETTLQEDIERFCSNPRNAQNLIATGKLDTYIRNHLEMQRAQCDVFDACVEKGLRCILWDTGKQSAVPIADTNGGKVQILLPRKYEAFRKTGELNPEGGFTCEPCNESYTDSDGTVKQRYLKVILGDDILPGRPDSHLTKPFMALIAGPPGSGKSTFCNEFLKPFLKKMKLVWSQYGFYQERDDIRNRYLASQGYKDWSEVPSHNIAEIMALPDRLYETAQDSIALKKKTDLYIEWPFSRWEDVQKRVAQAADAGYVPELHMLFVSDIHSLTHRNMDRRFPDKEIAKKALQNGKLDHLLKQMLEIRKAMPSIFERCRQEGIAVTLWESSGTPPRRIAYAEKGDALTVLDKSTYEAFQRTAHINPDASITVEVRETPSPENESHFDFAYNEDLFSQPTAPFTENHQKRAAGGKGRH